MTARYRVKDKSDHLLIILIIYKMGQSWTMKDMKNIDEVSPVFL